LGVCVKVGRAVGVLVGVAVALTVGVVVGWLVLVGGATVAVGAVFVGVKVIPTSGSSSFRQAASMVKIKIEMRSRIRRRIVPNLR
jgi:phosphate/sulfate permease